MKIRAYVCLATAGVALGASCTSTLEGEGPGAAGAAGEHTAVGAGGEAGAGNDVGGSLTGVAGAPAAGAGSAGPNDGGARSDGGAGGEPQAGAAGEGGGGPLVPFILEYEDDFNAGGDWVLDANPDTEIATAQIADGRLFVNAEQYNNCPSASAKLQLPELATPYGTTTIWKVQLVNVNGSAAGKAPLVLNRDPRRVTIDLMTIGDVENGELVVTSSAEEVTITLNGVAPPWAEFSVGPSLGPPGIELSAIACGADLLAGAQVGVTHLEVISVPPGPVRAE